MFSGDDLDSDPYVVFRLGDKIYSSKIIKDTPYAEWTNAYIVFDHKLGEDLKIESYDEDLLFLPVAIGGDEDIGT